MRVRKKIYGVIMAAILALAMTACDNGQNEPSKKVDSVSVMETKSEYFVGDAYAGGKLSVKYDDDTTETVSITADMVTGFDSSSAGEKTLTVTYGGKSAQYKITVREAIEVTVGENFDSDAAFKDDGEESWGGITSQTVFDAEHGFLTFREKSNASVAYLAKGMSTGTMEFKMRLKHSLDTTASIVFGNQAANPTEFCYKPGGKCYALEFAADANIYIKKWVDEEETVLSGNKSSAAISPVLGLMFTDIKIVVGEESGAVTVKVYVDGNLELDVRDSSDPILGGGAIGFSYMGTGGMVVAGKSSKASDYEEPEALGITLYDSPEVEVASGTVDMLANFSADWTGRERIFNTKDEGEGKILISSLDNPEEPQAGVTEYQALYKSKIFGDVQFEYKFNVVAHGEWIMFWFRCVPEKSTNVSVWGNKQTKENTNGYSMLIDPTGVVQIHKWTDGAQLWLNGQGKELPGTVCAALKNPTAEITVKMSIETANTGGRDVIELRVSVNDCDPIVVQDTDKSIFVNPGYTGMQGFAKNNGTSAIRLLSATASDDITLY